MKINVNCETKPKFRDIKRGECFCYSGNIYLRFDRLLILSSSQDDVEGSTRHLGGYNCVRLSDGRPGSFEDTTSVVPIKAEVRGKILD